MKRRVLSVLLCAGLVVSVLAGCGSDDAKKDSGKKAASESDLDYVKEKGTLVVGITNFEPMDYQDEEGECYFRGLSALEKGDTQANGSVLMRIWRRRSERASA